MFYEGKIHCGRVKSWSNVNGFGFIEPTDGLEIFDKKGKKLDVFVHFSCIKGNGVRNLYRGQEVKFTFTLSDRGKGYMALDVVPINAWWEALMPIE